MLLVVIDYFTKWVEAEALSTIMEAKIQNFIWKNIVCRFGIPRTIILDNGNSLTVIEREKKRRKESAGIYGRKTLVRLTLYSKLV